MANPFTAPPLDVTRLDDRFTRADVELHGVDHSGSSYEGRVYVNNPAADAQTPRTAEAGYVGSYHVFGHGGCLGDPGHCDVHPRDPFDPRPGHPLTRARKVVIATERLREPLEGDELTITIVPVVRSVGPKSGDADDIVKLDSVRIVTYR
jgi:hypothetical protein